MSGKTKGLAPRPARHGSRLRSPPTRLGRWTFAIQPEQDHRLGLYGLVRTIDLLLR